MVALLSLSHHYSHYKHRVVIRFVFTTATTAPYGAPHRTLATIDIPAISGTKHRDYITNSVRGRALISGLERLDCDSIAIRDLDDYKGRIPYSASPFMLNRKMHPHS